MTSFGPRVANARLAAMAVLFCNGLLYSIWGVSIALLKLKFGLSESMLSLSMAAVALGGIATMAMAGRWIALTGSGKASVRSGILMAVSAAPILLIPTYGWLLVILVIYGTATAANDVAANAQGAYLEKLAQRSVIGSLHGSFSMGGLLGALVSSTWSKSGLPLAASFYCVGLVVCVAMTIASRFMLNESRNALKVDDTKNFGTAPLHLPIVRRRLLIFVPHDLMHHRCLRIRTGVNRIYHWELGTGEDRVALDVLGSVTLDDSEAAIRVAARSGGLFYCLEQRVEAEIANGSLEVVLPEYAVMGPGFYAYYASHRRVPAALRALVDYLKEA